MRTKERAETLINEAYSYVTCGGMQELFAITCATWCARKLAEASAGKESEQWQAVVKYLDNMKNMRNITRIKPPKYRVNGLALNEYELRALFRDVCLGWRSPGIVVRDEKGGEATIQADGTLKGSLYGIDICSNFTMEMIRHRREARNKPTS